MKQIVLGFLTVAAMASFTSTAGAQRFGRNDGFEKAAPKIGDLLPDISAYDAEGKKLRLRSLKGHYSVLVFGCLT